MGNKQDVINEIYNLCERENRLVFDNDEVKKVARVYGFANPFDVTKWDNSSKLPSILKDKDYFILHLGEGRHMFVKGIKHGYHAFEEIDIDETFEWKYRKSILNEFDTSESNILSVASNQRIIHDFLYEDIVANPKVYNSRRTKMDLSYNVGQQRIVATRLQMEIDLTFELNGVVTIFEGKNGFSKDFAIYQIFHPFKYFSILREENRLDLKEITCCYVLRKKVSGNSILRLYNYTFEDQNDMGSLRLIKKAQYNLIRR